MGIVIRKVSTAPHAEQRAAYWRGAPWKELIRQVAQLMGDQARNNIIKFGEPGGRWAKLSGYNGAGKVNNKARPLRRGESGKNASNSKSDRQRRKALNAEARFKSNKANQVRKLGWKTTADKLVREARSARAQSIAIGHVGYARQKAMGKTPGHGRFGADVRLRDTGELFASLYGLVKYVANGALIALKAKGRKQGRPSNQQLLEFHSEGNAKLPKRNPAEDMRFFEKELMRLRRSFLANAPQDIQGGPTGPSITGAGGKGA